MIMISCREATAFTDKHMHAGLTWGEHLRWWMHLAMCRACSAYEKQSRFIEAALRHIVRSDPPQPMVGEEEVTRLKKKILGE